MSTKASYFDYFFLILLSAIWGSSFLFIKISIETIPASLLTFIRLFVASVFLIVYLKLKTNHNLLDFRNLKEIFIISVLGNIVPFNLIGWSEKYVDSVIAAALIGTMPLFTFVIAHFHKSGEKLNLKIIFGLAIGFCGMCIIINNNFYEDKQRYDLIDVSNVLIILAAICYALSANLIKKIKNISPIQISTSSCIVATFLSLPVFFIFNFNSNEDVKDILIGISRESILSSIILGILCNAVAATIFFKLIQKQSAGFASQSNFFIPCFGLLWSFLFLNEDLNNTLFFSVFLIIIGVIFVHFGRKMYT